MLTGGILVGAAGTLLTILMCNAMNRSLLNVLIGSFGGGAKSSGGTSPSGGTVKEITLSDTAVLMTYASKVMIVPGYGLAVAQAQHACHELEKLLESKGVDVFYAIHPVAGRMPGHMNVLLAETDVPYEKLMEMEQANEEFSTADVVLILGANDVVNPAAKEDTSSPIYGMPILEVELAKNVIVGLEKIFILPFRISYQHIACYVRSKPPEEEVSMFALSSQKSLIIISLILVHAPILLV
jgi:NAD(P) transhydrogenase subunit beta